MTIDYFKYTNNGERDVNEDSVGVYEQNGFYAFALCDGLGGHGMGDVASSTVVEAMLCEAAQKGFKDDTVDVCFEKANETLLQKQEEKNNHGGMKTTGTLLLIQNYLASWGHIGDSRIYYFKDKKYTKRSIDHSVPQMMVLSGEIKDKHIRNHPDRNRLLRCLPWITKKYEIDETNQCIDIGDCFMMMSDGFWELIDEKTMTKVLKKTSTAQEAVDMMVKHVFKKGSGKNMDNLSVIVVKIS